jgi:hypothetical protein
VTLLVVAPEADETARRFADFAVTNGVPAVVANGFGRVRISVVATRDRAVRTRITVDDDEVTGVLNRGVGDWGREADAEAAFIAAETYAALWSALALWPGPVLNRPSAKGFLPRLDPLELVASGAVAPPRTVILNEGSAPGADVYRLPDWTKADPDAPRSRFDVVRITDRDPVHTRHFLMAGTEVFDVGGELATGPPTPVLDWLRGSGVDFADFTVEQDRLFDVSCWPSHRLFPHLEDRVYAALLHRLIR